LVPFPKRPFPMSFWLRWNESRMNMLYSTSQKNFLWKKNKKKEGKCEKQKQKNVVSVRENFRTYFISICGDASSVNWWYAVFCWTVVCWVCWLKFMWKKGKLKERFFNYLYDWAVLH
jgi:hypothetical protein